MDTRQQMETVRQRIRDAVRQALREAVERAPGNRAAALRRARDELLQVLSRAALPNGESAVEELSLRSTLTIEIEAAATELLRELAGRR